MNAARIEPEQIAAFLEGRLSNVERTRVIAHLADSPESYQLFSEAADDLFPESHDARASEWERDKALIKEFLSEPHSESTRVPVVSGWDRVRRSVERYRLQYAAVAAAAVSSIVVGQRLSTRLPAFAAHNLAAAVYEQTDVTGEYRAAFDRPGWSVTRGAGTGLSPDQMAFRLGVRLVDLTIAIETGDSLSALTVSAEMDRLLPLVDAAPEEVLLMIREIARQAREGIPFDSITQLIATTDGQLNTMLDGESYGLGLWSGAARLAAQDRNVEFFESDTSVKVAARAPRRVPDDAAEALRELETLAGDGVADGEFPEIERLIGIVMSSLGG